MVDERQDLKVLECGGVSPVIFTTGLSEWTLLIAYFQILLCHPLSARCALMLLDEKIKVYIGFKIITFG
ncbi:hypothetical protein [Nostoc sp.]|uniref:hypothetical protein n=1 Tax=Nostoc sp. TaxID=1180 RepID=UPI002FF91C4F